MNLWSYILFITNTDLIRPNICRDITMMFRVHIDTNVNGSAQGNVRVYNQ